MLFFKKKLINTDRKAESGYYDTAVTGTADGRQKPSVPTVVLSCLLVAGAIAAGIAQNNASITALAAKDSGKAVTGSS